jgi:glycosyltransferase involved in cell wall biosynthesis
VRYLRHIALLGLEAVLFGPTVIFAMIARCIPKSFDVGLGPEPIVSYVYHKKALEGQGYSAQTFVQDIYHITDAFDVRADLIFRGFLSMLRKFYLFALVVSRYRCLYTSFKGGPLGSTVVLWRIEPLLYRIARVKMVILPYGADVQVLTRSPNLLYKHAMGQDYPGQRSMRRLVASKIDLWTRNADHIIGGCEWVDYMFHWDTVMLSHFSIDTEQWKPDPNVARRTTTDHRDREKLTILHAPNHKALKGTNYFKNAVDELKEEGFSVELKVAEKVPNLQIKTLMQSVDLVADQLVIGWYAMFAIEAMATGKPVLCYLRQDLKQFYVNAGLIATDEIPIIECSPVTVKEVIKRILCEKEVLGDIGKRSRAFVEKHHSLESVGKIFLMINRSMGIMPMDQTLTK